MINLDSSLPGLASTLPQIRVAAGATNASFEVVTNGQYRRFSGLAFSAAISAINPASGVARSATLNVTAQARPNLIVRNPIPGAYSGPLCAGEPGLLYDCRLLPDGSCSFVAECPLGCEGRPTNGSSYQDRCATAGPAPVTLASPRLVGGNPGTATVQLATAATAGSTALLTATLVIDGAAPAGGFQVTLTSDKPALVDLPASVLIPAGSDRTSFTIGSRPVSFDTSIYVRAYPGPVTGASTLTLKPGAAAGPVVSGLSLSPNAVNAGSGSTATVVLGGAAPAGGAQVAIASNIAAAQVPATVTAPAGATLASFPVTTGNVGASTLATITATLGSSGQSASLTITAAAGTLTAPTQLAPGNGSRLNAAASTVFDWSDVAGASAYAIDLDSSSGFTIPLTLSRQVSASTTTISGLAAGTYYWRVRAIASSGVTGSWSAVRSVQLR